MDFNTFQEIIGETAIYPNRGKNIIYPTLGLAGEAGEVAEKVKKIIRDHNGVVTPEFKQEIIKELGDVLWYVAALSSELGVTMEEVAKLNMEKLLSRKKRGVISGNGDNR